MGHISQVNGEAFQLLVSYQNEEEDQADQRGDQQKKSTEQSLGCSGAVNSIASLSRCKCCCPAGENSLQTSFQIFIVGHAATKRVRTFYTPIIYSHTIHATNLLRPLKVYVSAD
jgi:hypothetical protein